MKNRITDQTKNSRKAKILIGFFSTTIFLLGPMVSKAQVDHSYTIDRLPDVGTNKDFVVGPGKAEIQLYPGQTQTYPIKVTNRLGETKTFKIEVEDFTGSNNPEQTVVLLGDQRGPYSLRDYLRVPSYEFTLQSGERATIPVTVSIPVDEEPGGRYGSVIVSMVSNQAELEKGAASAPIISRIGVLFFVTIPGDIQKEGVLKDFRTKAKQKMFGKGSISFELLFENTGTVHLNPYGEIRVKNLLGKEVGSIIADPWFAMPGSLRYREISWARPFLFGMYKAETSINRGYGDNGGIIDTDSFAFFVLPWKLIVGVLGSIIGLVLVIKILLRFFLNRFELKRKI